MGPCYSWLYSVFNWNIYTVQQSKKNKKCKDRKQRNKIIGINRGSFLDRQYTILKIRNSNIC